LNSSTTWQLSITSNQSTVIDQITILKPGFSPGFFIALFRENYLLLPALQFPAQEIYSDAQKNLIGCALLNKAMRTGFNFSAHPIENNLS
jgi:hypothetical protein